MKGLLVLLFLATTINRTNAQSAYADSISRVIVGLDSVLFSCGFNQGDIHVFEQMIHADFEFYHDIGGYQDRDAFLQSLRSGLFADVKNYRSVRYLASTQVHPLYRSGVLYGVIQTGEHRFYELIGDNPEKYASTALFTHYWELDANGWKLKRVFSYDHHQ